MDVRHFTHFLAVVESKSVGRAADTLKITQPALSKSIRRLEDSLQVKLFDRGPEGMVPTIYAEALAERARFIAIEMKRAIEEIHALRGGVSGSVAIGAGPSLMVPVIGPATVRLAAKRPDIRIAVVEGFLETSLRLLRNGDLDLVVGTRPESGELEGVEGEFLFRDDIVIAVRKNHPLVGQRRISFDALRKFPWVTTQEQDPMPGRIRELFVKHRLEPPVPRVTSNSATYMKAVLVAGDFISMLPRHLIAAEEAAGSIVPLSVSGALWRRDVLMMRRKRNTIAPSARALIAELRKVCNKKRGNGR